MSRHRDNTERGRFRQGWRGAVISWLCLALVGFNLLAGSGLPVLAGSGLGESIVVCSAGGMTVVDPGAASEVPPSSHGELCAFCLPLLHGGAQAAAQIELVVRSTTPPAVIFLPRRVAILARFEQGGGAGPRAPPVI
jgi:hypothetical protein